jgi:hypothetical protein
MSHHRHAGLCAVTRSARTSSSASTSVQAGDAVAVVAACRHIADRPASASECCQGLRKTGSDGSWRKPARFRYLCASHVAETST